MPTPEPISAERPMVFQWPKNSRAGRRVSIRAYSSTLRRFSPLARHSSNSWPSTEAMASEPTARENRGKPS